MIKVVNEGKYSDAEKKKIYNQWKEYCKKNYKKFIPEYGPDGYTDAMYDQWVKVLKKESGDSNAKTESNKLSDFRGNSRDGNPTRVRIKDTGKTGWVDSVVDDKWGQGIRVVYDDRSGMYPDFFNVDEVEILESAKPKTESLDDDFERYTRMKSKDVNDADGYITEYTMYFDEVDGRYVFVFGDSDLYNPNDGYEEFDWETESRDEAEDWFRDYDGFSDELESKKITESEAKKILIVADGRPREVSSDRFSQYAKKFGYGSYNLSFKYIGSKHGNVDDHTCYEVDISGCPSYKDATKAVRTVCDYIFGTGNCDLRTYDEDTVSEFTESKEESKMIKIIDEAKSALSADRMHRILRNWLNAQDEVEMFDAVNDDGYNVYSYGATDYDLLGRAFEDYLRKTINWDISHDNEEFDDSFIVICAMPGSDSREIRITFTTQPEDSDDSDIYVEIEDVLENVRDRF